MPAKDVFHQLVKKALEAEGWTVADDLLRVRFLGVELRIDLGAERVIAAERGD